MDTGLNDMLSNSSLSVSAGAGLSTTSQSIALGGTGTLSVNVDDNTIEINESDKLQLKDLKE